MPSHLFPETNSSLPKASPSPSPLTCSRTWPQQLSLPFLTSTITFYCFISFNIQTFSHLKKKISLPSPPVLVSVLFPGSLLMQNFQRVACTCWSNFSSLVLLNSLQIDFYSHHSTNIYIYIYIILRDTNHLFLAKSNDQSLLSWFFRFWSNHSWPSPLPESFAVGFQDSKLLIFLLPQWLCFPGLFVYSSLQHFTLDFLVLFYMKFLPSDVIQSHSIKCHVYTSKS